MTLTKKGDDVLARPWRGSCHTCSAEYLTDGREVNELNPGSHLMEITAVDCPACGAQRKLYLKPQTIDIPKPPPLPDHLERQSELSVRRSDLMKGQFNSLLKDSRQFIPGFITVREVYFSSVPYTRDLRESDLEGSLVSAFERTIAVSEIVEAAPGSHYEINHGILVLKPRREVRTVETYEELLTKLHESRTSHPASLTIVDPSKVPFSPSFSIPGTH